MKKSVSIIILTISSASFAQTLKSTDSLNHGVVNTSVVTPIMKVVNTPIQNNPNQAPIKASLSGVKKIDKVSIDNELTIDFTGEAKVLLLKLAQERKITLKFIGISPYPSLPIELRVNKVSIHDILAEINQQIERRALVELTDKSIEIQYKEQSFSEKMKESEMNEKPLFLSPIKRVKSLDTTQNDVTIDPVIISLKLPNKLLFSKNIPVSIQLRNYGVKFDWILIWDADDFEFSEDVSMIGNFERVLENTIVNANAKGIKIKAIIYRGNKTIRVIPINQQE